MAMAARSARPRAICIFRSLGSWSVTKKHERVEEASGVDERQGVCAHERGSAEAQELRSELTVEGFGVAGPSGYGLGHVAGRGDARRAPLGQLHDDRAVGLHMVDRSVGEQG